MNNINDDDDDDDVDDDTLNTRQLTSIARSQILQGMTAKTAFYFSTFQFCCTALIQFCCTTVLFLFTAGIGGHWSLHSYI